jgi:hypothetical protein
VRAGHETNDSPDWVMQARSRLARRRAERPATKAGQIRALWPDIEAALAVGQSMKTICEWLAQDAGITLGVTSLTSYVSRIRRRERLNQRASIRLPSASAPIPPDPRSAAVPARAAISQSPMPTAPNQPRSKPDFDPLANVRARLAKRPGFDYHPATEDDAKDLI